MKKILLVIQREYVTRVRKTSFWVLTLLVPLAMALLYAIPIYLSSQGKEHATILVVDETDLFADGFRSSADITYRPAGSLDYARRLLDESDSIDAILYIPVHELSLPTDAFLYYLSEQPPQHVQTDVNNQLQTLLRNNILWSMGGITPEEYHRLTSTTMRLHQRDIEDGRDGFFDVKMVLALVLALVVFIAVMSFASQVMRGVMEEKSSRIVEVLACSLKPFQLMMGKVVGNGLVGLTQFALWLILSVLVLFGIRTSYSDLFARAEQQLSITEVATKGTDATAQMEQLAGQEPVSEIIQGLLSIDYGLIIGVFLFFFLCGYLLYASLYAAVGTVTNTNTDTQPFSLLVTIPLILPMLVLPAMTNAPSGSLATWLSLIPFTSPVAMLFRLPFGVPTWQMLLAMALLLATLPAAIYLAARIYKKNLLK